METGEGERRCRRGGRGVHRRHRRTRGGRVSEGDTERPEGRQVSTVTGEAAIHPQRGREAEAAGDTDGEGSRGADGDQAGD